ncbi:MAG: hypothetical protein Kow0037_00320 [Calditrichia bacterium]
MNQPLTLIWGVNELSSSIAATFLQAGLPVGMLCTEVPRSLKTAINFAEAFHHGRWTIDGVTAALIEPEEIASEENSLPELWRKAVIRAIRDKVIPLWTLDDFPQCWEQLEPTVIIFTEPTLPGSDPISLAPHTVGMAPLHQPGRDCRITVETRLRYHLGQVYHEAAPNIPERDPHFFKDPFTTVKTPIEGLFIAYKELGDEVHLNEPLGTINQIEIRSPEDGQVWGLFHSGKMIQAGQPLAKIFLGKSRDEFRRFGFFHQAVAGVCLREYLRFINNLS